MNKRTTERCGSSWQLANRMIALVIVVEEKVDWVTLAGSIILFSLEDHKNTQIGIILLSNYFISHIFSFAI